MKHKIIYFLFISLSILSCKRDSKKPEITTEIKKESDSIADFFWANDFDPKEFKMEQYNNGYGKSIRIDSVNIDIFKRYFIDDSSKLKFEGYTDRLNDTVIWKEYFFNGNLKEVTRRTYASHTLIKKHSIYNKKGELIKETDYDKDYNVSFDEAVNIAEKNGMKKPFVVGISKDSMHWEILIWKNIEFDTITNEGIDKGKGLSIKRNNGQTERIERINEWVE
jgi:hypothetical protein